MKSPEHVCGPEQLEAAGKTGKGEGRKEGDVVGGRGRVCVCESGIGIGNGAKGRATIP